MQAYVVFGGNYNFFIGFKPSSSNHWAIAAQVEIFEYLLLYLGSNQIPLNNDALITELQKLLLRWLYLERKIKIVILLIFLSLLVYRHNLSKDYYRNYTVEIVLSSSIFLFHSPFLINQLKKVYSDWSNLNNSDLILTL